MTPHFPPDPQRRAWLELAGALALAGVVPVALAQSKGTTSGQAFAALSQSLTGYPPPDAATTATMQRAFATPQRRAALAALAAVVASTAPADLAQVLAERKLDTTANELVAAWYSGVVTTARGDALVLYANAFMWTAMTWTKPMGVCGGVTDYWSGPPS